MDRLKYDNALFAQECRKRARFGRITKTEAVEAFWAVANNYCRRDAILRPVGHVNPEIDAEILAELDEELWVDEQDFIRETLAEHGIKVEG